MKKKLMINQLKLEFMEKLNLKEKQIIIKDLRDNHKLSLRKIADMIGVSHSSILSWYNGKHNNSDGKYNTTISINTIKNYFTNIHKKPSNSEERNKVKELIIILMEWVKR